MSLLQGERLRSELAVAARVAEEKLDVGPGKIYRRVSCFFLLNGSSESALLLLIRVSGFFRVNQGERLFSCFLDNRARSLLQGERLRSELAVAVRVAEEKLDVGPGTTYRRVRGFILLNCSS